MRRQRRSERRFVGLWRRGGGGCGDRLWFCRQLRCQLFGQRTQTGRLADQLAQGDLDTEALLKTGGELREEQGIKA